MSTPASARRTRGSLSTWLAFGVGAPLGAALLYSVLTLPQGVEGSDLALLQRYLEHPVEHAEIVLFFCALGALLGKFIACLAERAALKRAFLPAWNGKPQAVDTAGPLLASVAQQPARWRGTLVGRRIEAVLGFVHGRGSANELDDQLRALSDSDAMSNDGSYSLLRFITWAIPILGFLGTVLGITDAIYGVTPELLEKGLDKVTGGLATAFDTTALALLLTMILMFFSFLAEKLEGSVLEGVDQRIDDELAHRFERMPAESSQFVAVVRQNTDVLLAATQQLVERQAAVWAGALEKADRAWTDTGSRQQAQFLKALDTSLERTLTIHAGRLRELEDRMVSQTQKMLESMTALAGVLRDTGKQHQEGLVKVTDSLKHQTAALAALQQGEGQLLKLQQTLQNNLSAVTATGAFEEAVQTLTGAIHVLTARAPRLAA